MSRVLIAPQVLKAATDRTAPTAGQLDLTMTASDAVNFQSCVLTGKEILLAQNTDTGTHHITITTAPDSLGRTSDIASYALATTKIAAFDANTLAGWQQSDGKLYFGSDDATVKFAVLKHS